MMVPTYSVVRWPSMNPLSEWFAIAKIARGCHQLALKPLRLNGYSP
jgi:hypothetical protein